MLTSVTPKVLQVTILLQIYPVIELIPLKSKISKRRFQVTKKSRLGGKAICGEDPFYDDYYSCEPADGATKNKTKEEKKVTEDWYFSEELALENKEKKQVKLKNSSPGKIVQKNQKQDSDTTSTGIQWMSSPPLVQELPEEFRLCNDLSKCKFYYSTYKVNYVAVE